MRTAEENATIAAAKRIPTISHPQDFISNCPPNDYGVQIG
jgi:hypothetical protein